MTTVITAPRTVHVEHCMGTVFTLDLRDRGDWTAAIAEAVAWLHRVDAVFSTYRPDSDISRIRQAELRVSDADPLVGTVLRLCAEVQLETGGAFTAMPDGRLDPTGLVKGWAIERAATLLGDHGAANFAVNGGGDLQLVGEAGPGRPWQIGIADPHDGTKVLTVVAGRDLAVATSGTAERGAHILDPFTRRPVTAQASATVIGPSLTRADAYATAAFVLGTGALPWIENVPGYEALVVSSTGEQARTAGFTAAELPG